LIHGVLSFFKWQLTLGILFTVSPHKNIKKAINGNVLAKNVLRANEKIMNKTK